MEKHGKYIEVWADFNPKILLMRGNAEQIDDLSEDQLRRLRQMDGNTELIGKKIDGGVVVGDEYARRFNAGDVDESFDDLMGMESREIREITSVSSSKSTYQLRKGITEPKPPNFQAHHIIPEEILEKLDDFFKKINFDGQKGDVNGMMLAPDDDILQAALKNDPSLTSTFNNRCFHKGSHPDYSRLIEGKIQNIARDLRKGFIDAVEAHKRVEDVIFGAKNALNSGKGTSLNEIIF